VRALPRTTRRSGGRTTSLVNLAAPSSAGGHAEETSDELMPNSPWDPEPPGRYYFRRIRQAARQTVDGEWIRSDNLGVPAERDAETRSSWSRGPRHLLC
jgi:hypothetical protein